MTSVVVLGATTWGTTLAILLARKGTSTFLLTRSEEETARLREAKENPTFLPGITFPEALTVTHIAAQALAEAAAIILAVPSASMRGNLRRLQGLLQNHQLLISATKGLELDSGLRMSQVIAQEVQPSLHPHICALSGPNLALEVARGLPATSVVASQNLAAAEAARDLLMGPTFRVYTNPDIIGVELGGSLKNIIALGAGISDGLGFGDNAKAALITRGLVEMTRLGTALGANPFTFSGLAGLGDLVTTCASPLSRNHYVGEQLAKGRSLEDILSTMTNVAEGVNTTKAALEMAHRAGVEMPITEQMYQVLFQGKDPRQAVAELMLREAKPEAAYGAEP
jgi:glycerol-3-phosphate dehydrogenase (NAD(P)+)